MRFYLDNDVDARCRRVVAPPHNCWTAADAGRSDADDADQAVYAHEQGAVLVTHDREFTGWRRRAGIGQHVRLCCEQPDGPDLLASYLDEVVLICARHPNVTIELRPGRLTVDTGWDPPRTAAT